MSIGNRRSQANLAGFGDQAQFGKEETALAEMVALAKRSAPMSRSARNLRFLLDPFGDRLKTHRGRPPSVTIAWTIRAVLGLDRNLLDKRLWRSSAW